MQTRPIRLNPVKGAGPPRRFSGHVAPGCIVRTTAEALQALLPDWEFSRAPDATTGYDELVVRAREVAKGTQGFEKNSARLAGLHRF